jgi:hypothetical protein
MNIPLRLSPYAALKPLDYRTTGSTASFGITTPSTPQSYRVISLRDGELSLDVLIESEAFNIRGVQPLGQDLLLVCSRRPAWTSSAIAMR